jgi:hypothetical protein
MRSLLGGHTARSPRSASMMWTSEIKVIRMDGVHAWER